MTTKVALLAGDAAKFISLFSDSKFEGNASAKRNVETLSFPPSPKAMTITHVAFNGLIFSLTDPKTLCVGETLNFGPTALSASISTD